MQSPCSIKELFISAFHRREFALMFLFSPVTITDYMKVESFTKELKAYLGEIFVLINSSSFHFCRLKYVCASEMPR